MRACNIDWPAHQRAYFKPSREWEQQPNRASALNREYNRYERISTPAFVALYFECGCVCVLCHVLYVCFFVSHISIGSSLNSEFCIRFQCSFSSLHFKQQQHTNFRSVLVLNSFCLARDQSSFLFYVPSTVVIYTQHT